MVALDMTCTSGTDKLICQLACLAAFIPIQPDTLTLIRQPIAPLRLALNVSGAPSLPRASVELVTVSIRLGVGERTGPQAANMKFKLEFKFKLNLNLKVTVVLQSRYY